MQRFISARLMSLAVLLAIGTAARATPIPPDSVAWNYNFNPGAPAVKADGNPSAGVTFTNEPTKTAVGSSDIVATNLRVFSSATAASPDKLTTNGNYSLTLQLTLNDNGTPVTKSLTFTGKLSGKFSAENAIIKNVFGPNSTQVATLGSYSFTVQLMAYTPPGPPDQSNAGSISAHVTVSRIVPTGVPEPSTMLLSGLGLSLLGGGAWRKRRQARVVTA